MQIKQPPDTKAKSVSLKRWLLTAKLSLLILTSCLTACGTMTTSLPPTTVVVPASSASVDIPDDSLSATKAANETLIRLSESQRQRLTEQQSEAQRLKR